MRDAIDVTVAVTQNFCSSTNLEQVYLYSRHSRPRMTARLVREIALMANHGEDSTSIWYAGLYQRIETLKTVPQLPPSSSDSGSTSTTESSSTSSEDIDVFEEVRNHTQHDEHAVSNGTQHDAASALDQPLSKRRRLSTSGGGIAYPATLPVASASTSAKPDCKCFRCRRQRRTYPY
jgi:hypothetical protein